MMHRFVHLKLGLALVLVGSGSGGAAQGRRLLDIPIRSSLAVIERRILQRQSRPVTSLRATRGQSRRAARTRSPLFFLGFATDEEQARPPSRCVAVSLHRAGP